MRALGRVNAPAIGVLILQSGTNRVAHNHIHDLYYTAISVGWNWGYQETPCRENIIEFNHLHNIGQGMLSDMGAVYTLGKLTDELSYEVPVVHAATTQAMNDLELRLSEDRSDKLTAHMESEFADGTNIWIDAQSIAEGRTKLTIRVGVLGDEARARRVYEAIKQHLPREDG